MKRRLLNLLTALSLVACLSAASLWTRSYFVWDSVNIECSSRWLVINSFGGIISVWDYGSFFDSAGMHIDWRTDSPSRIPYAPVRDLIRLDFGGNDPSRLERHYLVFPQWPIVCVFGVLPAVRYIRRRAAARGFTVNAAEPTT
jgi:hypothetical protein